MVTFVVAFVILTVIVAALTVRQGKSKASNISSHPNQQDTESRHNAAALPLTVVP